MTTSRKQKTNVKKQKMSVEKTQNNHYTGVSEERDSIISIVRGLEGQVETAFRIKEMLQGQLDTLQQRLSDELDARARSEAQLSRRLEASEASKDALERELAETHENARAMREEIEQLRDEVERLRDKVTLGDDRTTDLCFLLEDQQATNRKLTETTARLENEIEMVNVNYESAKHELDAFKNAVRDIRNEATQTSGRVFQKYLRSDDADNLSID